MLVGFTNITPRVIYGDDNRADVYGVERIDIRGVAASTVALISKDHLRDNLENGFDLKGNNFGRERRLCSEEPFYNQPTLASCSGALVGEDLVMTAGHCVTSIRDCERYYFVFDYKMENAQKTPKQLGYDDAYSCKSIVERHFSEAGDYALIRLNRPVKGRQPLKMQTHPVQSGDEVYVIGHPAGLPTKVADGASVRSVEGAKFLANLDTFAGNSGSAVFNAKTNEIVGILVDGEEDFEFDRKRKCNVSYRCDDGDCTGEVVTGIEFIIKAIERAGSRP